MRWQPRGTMVAMAMGHPRTDQQLGRNALLVALVASALALPLPAKSKPRRSLSSDPDYVSALGTANRFLQAWQTRDHESGLLLLSDNAKNHTSVERLEGYFSPDATLPRAYQISRGKKLGPGRYSFPVALFERAGHTRNSQIIVVHTGGNDWAVERLP
ncbi:MAG TPA: hypothetical protein VGF06_14230 [Terriglobales bacterium]